MSTPFNSSSSPRLGVSAEDAQLLQSYLTDRGLEPKDFPDGLRVIHDNGAVLKATGYNPRQRCGRAYLYLHYQDPRGNHYVSKDGEPYAVVRFLGKPDLDQFAPLDEKEAKKGPAKVISPSGKQNQLHFEPIKGQDEGVDWYHLPDSSAVIWCESMVKAKAVNKTTGLPCIGLNGVYSYAASARGIEFLLKTYDVDLSRCEHFILFDSNTHKDEVAQARRGLAHKLRNIYEVKSVKLVDLPKNATTGLDQGPDDFIVSKGGGEEAKIALFRLLAEAEDYISNTYEDLLEVMSSRAVYCSSGAVVDRADKRVRSNALAKMHYLPEHREIIERKQVKIISGYELWLRSQQRTEVINPRYEYLGPEFIVRDEGSYYNVYKRGGAWPRPGDNSGLAKPIIDHMGTMMGEGLEQFRSYLKFLKYTGVKPTSFPVLHSTARGVGKGWMGKVVTSLLGRPNVLAGGNTDTFSTNFNGDLEGKRCIIINEMKVKGGEKDRVMNRIRTFIADPMVRIERKGVDSYETDATAGLIITANALEDVPNDGFGDRRLWYVECHMVKGSLDEGYWPPLHAACDNEEMMRGFATWVEEGEDVDFATWRPPMTEERAEAISNSLDSWGQSSYETYKTLKDEGWVCMRMGMVRMALKKISGWDTTSLKDKSLGSALIRDNIGWRTSTRKYGKNGEQAKVWVINEAKFEAIEHEGGMVVDEIERAVQVFGLDKIGPVTR